MHLVRHTLPKALTFSGSNIIIRLIFLSLLFANALQGLGAERASVVLHTACKRQKLRATFSPFERKRKLQTMRIACI